MNDIIDQMNKGLPNNPYNIIYDGKSNKISLVLDVKGSGFGESETISNLNNLLSLYNNNTLGIVKQPEMFLRKGKWTIEEEQYANKIIDVFNKGYLTDVGSGTTLRSYLSDRLRCDPMRITKKYAGNNCIGKQVFQGIQDKDVTPEEIIANEAELQRLEAIFYKKLGRSNRLQYGFVDLEMEEAMGEGGASSPYSLKERRLQRSPTAMSDSPQIVGFTRHEMEAASSYLRKTSSMPALKDTVCSLTHSNPHLVISGIDDNSRKRTHSCSVVEGSNINDDNAAELLMAFFNGAGENSKKNNTMANDYNVDNQMKQEVVHTSQLKGLWTSGSSMSLSNLQFMEEKCYDSGDSRSNKSGSPVVTDSESQSRSPVSESQSRLSSTMTS